MPAMDMNKLLDISLQQKASDIHITVGRPPSFRIHGEIKSLNTPPLTGDDTAALMKQITSERGQQEIGELGSTDFAISYFDKARFRVNVFKQKVITPWFCGKSQWKFCPWKSLAYLRISKM